MFSMDKSINLQNIDDSIYTFSKWTPMSVDPLHISVHTQINWQYQRFQYKNNKIVPIESIDAISFA